MIEFAALRNELENAPMPDEGAISALQDPDSRFLGPRPATVEVKHGASGTEIKPSLEDAPSHAPMRINGTDGGCASACTHHAQRGHSVPVLG